MEETFGKYISDHSNNKRFVDTNTLNNIVTMFKDENKLSNYISSFEVVSKLDNNLLAGYNFEDKKISIDLDRNISECIKGIEIDNLKVNEFEKYYLVNLYILNHLIHELNHALQYKKCIEGKYDLEKKLLLLSLEHNLIIYKANKKNQRISKDIINYLNFINEISNDKIVYLSAPSERMAILNSLKMELEILKFEDPNSIMNKYTNWLYEANKLVGYGEYAPTPFYMSIMENVKKAFNLSHNSIELEATTLNCKGLAKKFNCSLEGKVYYGLPIEINEKEELDKKILVLKENINKK